MTMWRDFIWRVKKNVNFVGMIAKPNTIIIIGL